MKQLRMGRILQKAFSGLEIVDATKPLMLFPTQEDFDKAVRMDPLHCGFAHTVARACGSTQAHFFKRYVYIDHVGDDGKRRVYRYCVSKGTSDAIEAFDKGKKVKIKRAFVLRAPGASETIPAQRASHKKWKQSDTFKAIKREKQAIGELKTAERQLEQATTLAKAADTMPGSAKARDMDRRVTSAKTQLAKARNAAETATKRVKEVRKASYGTGHAKPRPRDLQVRSGTGAWLKELAA